MCNEIKDKHIETEVIHKEIDLIQSCITRMANNSFLLKGWYISLISVIIAIVFEKGVRIELISLLILPITIIFWGLDSFFLKTETLYRWKYDWVIKVRLFGNTDFLYNLNPYNKSMWLTPNDKNSCLFKFIFSKTLIPMYVLPTIVTIVILVYHIIF